MNEGVIKHALISVILGSYKHNLMQFDNTRVYLRYALFQRKIVGMTDDILHNATYPDIIMINRLIRAYKIEMLRITH